MEELKSSNLCPRPFFVELDICRSAVEQRGYSFVFTDKRISQSNVRLRPNVAK